LLAQAHKLDLSNYYKQLCEREFNGFSLQSTCRHSHIDPIVDLGFCIEHTHDYEDLLFYLKSPILPYCVSEFFSRVNLHKLIIENKLSLSHVLQIGEQLFDAVLYLQTQKILHLDIKPENILALITDNDAKVRLTDFGLAIKVPETIITIRGKNVVGTDYFRDRSWINTGILTMTADGYSLAVTLCEMVYEIKHRSHLFSLLGIHGNSESDTKDTLPLSRFNGDEFDYDNFVILIRTMTSDSIEQRPPLETALRIFKECFAKTSGAGTGGASAMTFSAGGSHYKKKKHTIKDKHKHIKKTRKHKNYKTKKYRK